MGDESFIFARIFIDRSGLPAFYGLDEEESTALCENQEDVPPAGMHVLGDAQVDEFEKKYGYTHVCGNIFMLKLRSSPAVPDTPDFLENSISTLLEHLFEGIDIMLKGPRKFCSL
jgi:hypothetical protein